MSKGKSNMQDTFGIKSLFCIIFIYNVSIKWILSYFYIKKTLFDLGHLIVTRHLLKLCIAQNTVADMVTEQKRNLTKVSVLKREKK